MNPLVSIIIPTYNRKDLLDECLTSIYMQDYKNKEVIIVDNGSDDGTSEFIKKKYPEVIIIKNKENMCFSYARNQAINISNGEILLFLDSDAELINKKSISKDVELLSNNSIGEVGGEGAFVNNEIIGAVGGVFKRGKTPIFLHKNDGKIKETDFLTTCNCAVKRGIVERIGGFDIYSKFFEDMELGLKIRKLGYKNFICIDSAVKHKFSRKGRVNNYYFPAREMIKYNIKHKGIYTIPFSVITLYWEWIKAILYYLNINKLFKRNRTSHYEEIRNTENTLSKEIKITLILKQPFLIIRALLWNIIFLWITIKCRNLDFLDKDVLNNFKKPFFE